MPKQQIFGPTYEEMLYPETIFPELRQKALKAQDELDPVNLFNITWKNENNEVHKVVLPKELTGVDANIVVLLGKYFPSGSHKVGAAYATLVEGCIDGDIIFGKHTILGPSTGNFGIGVAYVCKLMGYESVIIIPDNMSNERYEIIKRYGGKLELTPGTESDVILTLHRTQELKRNPQNWPLAQFELLPNYRFHRYVTGNSAIEAVKDIGNGRVSCLVSAPGSAGTIAAGDQLKQAFPECQVVALEPYECSTLANGGLGQHRIEGIGDKMCTLIHNVLTTDFVALIHDDDCIKGLKIIQEGKDVLVKNGVSQVVAKNLVDKFGISGICNILGAIKMAKYLGLGPDDNIVTIATDGFDRYPSVLEELNDRYPENEGVVLERWFNDIFMKANKEGIYDFRNLESKERLFKQKEKDWLPFGYTEEYINSMRSMNFWEEEFGKIGDYDKAIKESR